MMKLSAIAALAKNHVIGHDNALPWDLPDDLQHFKALTLNKPIIMGRKTYESIGGPLPKRKNIVLTRQKGCVFKGCTVVQSLSEAIAACEDAAEAMVIGGEGIYRLAWPYLDYLYLTKVDCEVEGDVFFPELSPEWQLCDSSFHPADARHAYAMTFCEYQRRSGDDE